MKAIKHSHYEQYLRLSNDDASLLVSSGRWVFVSKFEARKAIERQRPHRSLLARIGMFAAAALAVIALLVLSTSARAADKSVPKSGQYRVCLTLAQAQQVFKGKTIKYREVLGERCWYAAVGKTPKKAEFIPRSTSVASKPVRAIQQEAQRTQGSAGAVPAAGDSPIRTDFTATLEDDAVLALSGKPESSWSFDAYWFEATGWKK